MRDVARSGVPSHPHLASNGGSTDAVALELLAESGGVLVRVRRDDQERHLLEEALAGLLIVQLTATSVRFGGLRWFVCPRPECLRRCRILYREVDTNARAFACRRYLNPCMTLSGCRDETGSTCGRNEWLNASFVAKTAV
jgi:hypothetical protein